MLFRKHEKIMEEVGRYVESHLHEKCNIHELAHHIGYSVKQLHRIIKETTDQSLSDYILTIKVDKAKIWLEETDMTISEIASLLGYDYAGHFSRMFRRMVDSSPMDYRKNSIKQIKSLNGK